MTRHTHPSFWIFSTFLLGNILVGAQQSSIHNCHSDRGNPETTCKTITLPVGFCGACPIGEYNEIGHFVDCTRTFLSDTPMCLAKFEEYVALNPCDESRKQALENFKNNQDEDARQILDYFVYSFCELGCDCIPRVGASRESPELELRRGNCQGHAHIDICRLFPDVQLVRLEGTVDDAENRPPVCPLIEQFIDTNQFWMGQAISTLDEQVRSFLERATEAGEVLHQGTYEACFDMESTQKRIVLLPEDKLHSIHSAKCVEPRGARSREGNVMAQYPCTSARTTQDLVFEQLDDRYYRIKVEPLDFCLTAEDVPDNARIEQRTCNNDESQQWQFLPHEMPGDNFQIRSRSSTKCIVSEALNNNHILRLKDCNPSLSTTAWDTAFPIVVSTSVEGSVSSMFSSKCLEAWKSREQEGIALSQYRCNDSKETQGLIFGKLSSGYYRIMQGFNGLCWEATSDTNRDRVLVRQQTCGDSVLAQHWQFIPHSTPGYFQIQSYESLKCISVSSKFPNFLLRLEDCDPDSTTTAFASDADLSL